MKKVVTVVGARPQFIKTAVVSPELRKHYDEVLIHTGQHYDYNMSECFFEELSIPKPDYNLGVAGGTHAQMTGKMLIEIEKVLIDERPDCILVYGDTNSTLAAALAAAKLRIPICHVEAGVRTHNMANPEEINRILTDRISSLLLTSTSLGVDELRNEGLAEKAMFVGDPMYDAFLRYRGVKNLKDVRLTLLESKEEACVPENYYYITCHREENTSDLALREILEAVNSLGKEVVYPVHPRNKERALRIAKNNKMRNVMLTEPVGYFESLALVDNCQKVVTDSGGIQREAFFARKQCVTVLDFVVWPETMIDNRNQLARPIAKDIIDKLDKKMEISDSYMPFGDGNAAEKIISAMDDAFG